MRIAQQENSVEKRGWVAWFTRETNKTSRQEACTTYVGRRRPSVLPKERKHWGLPGRILEAQAKLVRVVGSTLQMETQPEWERDMGRPVFRETDSNSLFSMVYFYTLRCYAKVTWGQQSWILSVRCFIQMYTEVLGVLHHLLARGPAKPSPCDSGQSTRTLISPGVIILKTDTTQIKLRSYRVRV